MRLVDQFQSGLDAPICLTWELTYACNLACVHCLSSSGRRDPRELSTAECKAVIDELERMQVFYVNIGGGEPTVRKDFWELVEYATAHHVGVKFSTNGSRIDAERAAWLRGNDYVDVQISLDGATAAVNDAVRGAGSYDTALGAMEHLAHTGFKLSVVITRENASQLDDFKAIADFYGAQLRLTRLRPSGRGADVWEELHPTQAQQRVVYDWLLAHGEDVLTGDSFFHLAAYGQTLPGLNLCGAGRVVCLIDPVGDVYACPFAIHDTFLAGNVRGCRRLHGRLALVGSVPLAARAAVRRSVLELRHVRRLPRRLHGGEVLHRVAARRAGPGMRARARRGGAGRGVGRAAEADRGSLAAASAPPLARAGDGGHSSLRRVAGLMPWFESVAEAERRARRTLPASVFKAIRAGTERGLTLSDNVAAFSELGFAPHVAGLSHERDLSTTVMGVDLALPVVLSPVGVQAVHPVAEVGVARAAAARGTALGLSGLASTGIEDVVAANPKTFAQLYWAGSRDAIEARVERARAAGAAGLILTLDWTFSHSRDWGSPFIPPATRPARDGAARAGGAAASALGVPLGAGPVARRRFRSRTSRAPPGSSPPTASGWGRHRRAGRTSAGCGNAGAGRSCSRA